MELMASWIVSVYGSGFETAILQLKCHPCASEGIKLPDGGFEQVAR